MSGGVDSSACAALLVDEGYDVIGVTMRLGHHDSIEPDAGKPSCCGVEGINDARRAAAQLQIPYYPVNYEALFAEKVVDYFTNEYLSGRTPNPCVMCNQELKFGKLMALADDLGAEYVATGHYARVGESGDRRTLLRALDRDKDQSYVLFSMTQTQLSRTLLPLGDKCKADVREVARAHGLGTWDKPESQEICFIGDDNYKRFLKERVSEAARPGPIVDTNGQKLGEHPGTAFYTVGQRKGLRLSVGEAVYVTEIHAQGSTIVVGKSDELLRNECDLERVNWVSGNAPTEAVRAQVKIRYRDAGAWATIRATVGGGALISFDEPRRAITPGQAAVFYGGDVVLGGGWIA